MARQNWIHAVCAAVPLLSAALLLPAQTRAQEIRSPYRFVEENQALGAFGGYLATDAGAAEVGPQSAPVFGARYTIRLNGPFSVEGEMGVAPTNRVVWDIEDEQLVRLGEADLSLLLLSGALRFNMTGPRTFHDVMPYLIIGGGAAVQLQGDNALDLELSSTDARYRFGTSFAGHLGGGAEWFAFGRVTLRGDARVLLWEVEVPSAFLRQDATLPSREWAQNYYLSASLSYRF